MSALGVPLVPLLHSIAANTGWMARVLCLVAAVAKEEWQWRCRWPARQQMALVSMAHALTDGLGIAARAAPRLPLVLVVPLTL